KVTTLAEVGILSAIAPLWETQSQEAVALPEDQAGLLVRYVVARWGADPVAWVLPLQAGAKAVERWKKIGQEGFSSSPHAPVLVCLGKDTGVFGALSDQEWVDMIGFPMSAEILDEPLRPPLASVPANTG